MYGHHLLTFLELLLEISDLIVFLSHLDILTMVHLLQDLDLTSVLADIVPQAIDLTAFDFLDFVVQTASFSLELFLHDGG